MVEEKYIELINHEIDGVTSAEESASLKEYLAQNREAQKLFDDLNGLSEMLSQVGDVEPSPNLKKNILNTIPRHKYSTKANKQTLPVSFNSLKEKFNFKYAFSFSFGLAFGVILFALFGGDMMQTSMDSSDLTGTMLLSGPPEKLEPFETITINLAEFQGTIELKHVDHLLLAEMTLSSRREMQLIIEFDESDISFRGFKQEPNSQSILKSGESDVGLVHHGENRYLLVFADKTPAVSAMTFKVLDGGVVYEKSVATGQGVD